MPTYSPDLMTPPPFMMATMTPLISQVYPPMALTGNSTIITDAAYGNGTYIISSSGIPNRSLFYMFDKDKMNSTTDNVIFNNRLNQYEDCFDAYNIFIVRCGYYVGTLYTVDTVTNQKYYGDWVQIQLPDAICLTKMVLNRRYDGARPRDCMIFGSQNGVDWYTITSATDMTYTNNETTVYSNLIVYYNYFRLAVNRVALDTYVGNISGVALRELELWGRPA